MLDRRVLLRSGGLAMVGLGLAPRFLLRTALASASRRRVLVCLFQRGAMDGLAAVAPLDGRELGRLRPRLVLPAGRSPRTGGAAGANGGDALLPLDDRFGLHPALGALLPFYRAGELAVIHAVGSPDPTRSHFDAQDYMETATPGRKGTTAGWLNRASGRLGHDATPFRAVALTPTLPRSLAGPEPALAVPDLARVGVATPGERRARHGASDAEREAPAASFEALYAASSARLLRATAGESFAAAEALAAVDPRRYRPANGARYPASPLGDALAQVAQLVRLDVGLEIAFVESGGWDTHVRQGAADGTFARLASDLAASLAAFWSDLEAERGRIVLLTMTEFGRTVRENGAGGTDHGHGSVMLAIGGNVAGGRVWGELPSLAPDALWEGRDLPVETDFRAVFAGVAGPHLGITEVGTLFPGWAGSPLALLRS